MDQFLRFARVTFIGGGGHVINPDPSAKVFQKIEFNVSKTLSGKANTASVTIHNLAPGTRNSVGKEFDRFQLECGYAPPTGGNNIGIITLAEIRDVEHIPDGRGNVATHIACGEGDKAFRHATIAKSYKSGAKVEDVLEDIYTELEKEGVTRGEWKLPDGIQPYKRPYAACSACTRELDQLGRSHRFYWSVQNGALEIVPADGYIGGVVLLTPRTGLVGFPTVTDNGIKCKALLNPEIRPGRRVRVESKTLDMNGQASGEYRVGTAHFNGNNHDNEFVVDIEAEKVSDGKVDEGKKK